jgi:hypothetical protein
MPRPLLPAIAAAAALAAGCGGDDDGRNAQRFEGEQREVARVVDDLEKASREGEAGRICDELFTEELARLIAARNRRGCEARVGEQQLDERARIDVNEIRVEGDEAKVGVRERDGDRVILTLRRDGDDWRILSITG